MKSATALDPGIDLMVRHDAAIVWCPECKGMIGDPRFIKGAKHFIADKPVEICAPIKGKTMLVALHQPPDNRPKCPHCFVRFNITVILQ